MVKYYRNTDGSSSVILAEIAYKSESDSSGSWSQILIGHDADGEGYIQAQAPFTATLGAEIKGGALVASGYTASFTHGIEVSGAKSTFKHDVDATGALTVTKTLTANGALVVKGKTTLNDDTQLIGDLKFNGQLKPNTNNWISQTLDGIGVGDESRPSSKNIIVWRINDANNAALMSEEMYFNADGSRDLRFNGRNRANTSWRLFLTIKEYADGEVGIIAADSPAESRTDHTLVTAKWVTDRNFAKDPNVVHNFGTETVNGTKTFNSTPVVNGATLIQSAPWSGVKISDTDRTTSVQRMLAVALDEDGKRFCGLEVSAASGGNRYLHVTMRKRDDSGWVSPFKTVELPDGTTYCEGSHHPPAGDNSYKLATTGWVVSQLSTSIPAGAIMYFAQSNVPDGWLFCNGSNVSRTTYANLFAAIGTKYGSGNGSSTFTLPNLRDIFIQGASSTSNVGQSVAAGLPNITGYGPLAANGAGDSDFSGVFYRDGSMTGAIAEGGSTDAKVSFSASRSSGLYGASTTVQPPAIRLLPCIKS